MLFICICFFFIFKSMWWLLLKRWENSNQMLHVHFKKKKCMTLRVKHNGCISSFLFWEMQRIPFVMKRFRVIEEIANQVAQEFDVLLCIEKNLKWVVCILLFISNIPHDFNCYTSCCCGICRLILYIQISRLSLLKFVQ